MRRVVLLTFLLTLPTALTGCPSDDGNTDEVGDTGDDGTAGEEPCPPAAGTLDESACMANPGDYVPGADDDYMACISDGGTYELFAAESPGAIARIEAYEQIANLLWLNGEPSTDDFVMARTQYELDEGLASRVERRADLHYPAIPEAEWDPGLDADKQCGNTMLAEQYPDYCVGPSILRPTLNQAFIDGIEGTGDPNINAAIIKANLLWFMALSSYKEAFTCFQIDGEDCDAAWAYYTGGAQLDGDLLGLGGFVDEHSTNTVSRFFDGILAVRCVRDLYPQDMYPAGSDLPPDGQALFDQAWEQLDQSLHRSLAITVRQHVEAQDSCGGAAAANWKIVQTLGGALQHEAGQRDAAAAAELEGLYGLTEPTAEDTARIVELLDDVFRCP